MQMFKTTIQVLSFIALLTVCSSAHAHAPLTPCPIVDDAEPEWGFWGHKRINRLAVFTLPPEMIGFYKKHIEYITDHAVDPDKRRYATKHEGVRHYIDIDHWGKPPFDMLPKRWDLAQARYAGLYVRTKRGDTLHLVGHDVMRVEGDTWVLNSPDIRRAFAVDSIEFEAEPYQDFYREHVLPQFYQETWTITPQQLREVFAASPIKVKVEEVWFIDELSPWGIAPWNLQRVQNKLRRAFEVKDKKKILRISAELGHYIGDIHVPLHTTKNYNGQLTNQVGIHGFWESRIPELFADERFDYFVGKAEYTESTRDFFWDAAFDSHALVDSVLQIEKRLSKTFPQDRQMCYEQRLDATVRTYCRDYAEAFMNEMDGMVEERMRATILAIGTAWMTAWVDAGSPDLSKWDEVNPVAADEQKELEEAYRKGESKGRSHGDNTVNQK